VQKTMVLIRQEKDNGAEEQAHEFEISNWTPMQSASNK